MNSNNSSNSSCVHVIHQKQRHTISDLNLHVVTLGELKRIIYARVLLPQSQSSKATEQEECGRMKLMCAGALMKDEKSVLSSFGIVNNSRILMILSPSPSNSRTSTSSNRGNSSSSSSNRKRKSEINDDTPLVINHECNHAGIHEAYETALILLTVVLSEFNEERELSIMLVETIREISSHQFNSVSDIHASIPRQKFEVVLKDLPTINEPRNKRLDKLYRYLNEKYFRILLALDAIDTQGSELVRSQRKLAVTRVQRILTSLDTAWKNMQAEREDE